MDEEQDLTTSAAGLAYRTASPDRESAGDVLLLHGFPESSFMWRHLLGPIAESGWRAVAPDLLGFGDSPTDRPGTWERQVEALERFRSSLGLRQVVLVVHDWGGLIGLRWACEHPESIRGLVISDTGFFPDGRWHGFAEALRTPGEGEQLIDAMTIDGLGQMLRALGTGFGDDAVGEYWKAFVDEERRRSILDLYRSGEFEKIARYEGCLGALGVPALLLWGEDDQFAPVAGAHRFMDLLSDPQLVVVEGTGHFLYADAPERAAREVVSFLGRL